jgi:hypothetical protein
MRKDYSIRLRVPEHLGSQIHNLALRESRSESAMISILVTESLAARRAAATQIAEVSKLTQMIRGESDGYPQ